MSKPWRVSDPATCNEENFATEEEALKYAKELLDGHREEARSDGEWPSETSELRVYKLVHSAQVSKEGVDPDGFSWADYELRPAT